MKKWIKAAWMAAASALAFTSCVEEQNLADQDEQADIVTININATGNTTKTHYDGTVSVKWNATGEFLQVIQHDGRNLQAVKSTEGATTDGGLTARFTADFQGSQAPTFDHYAIYPAANYIKTDNSTITKFKLQIPAEQHPTTNNFDPNADLLVSDKVVSTPQDKDINFRFARPVAIMEMTLKGMTAGEKLESAEFSSTTAELAGILYYDFTTATVLDYGSAEESKHAINCIFDKFDYTTTGTDKVYFTIFPTGTGNVPLGDFTVKVTTDKATYTKTVQLPEAKTIQANSLVKLGVSKLERVEKATDKYELLTDINKLSVGDKIIVTSGTDGEIVVMGANNKDYMKAIKGNAASGAISTIPVGTEIMEITKIESTATNTEKKIAFKTKDGYFETTGEKNVTSNSTTEFLWTVSVSESGIATMGTGTTKDGNLNYNSSSPRFTTYTHAQEAISIFYKQSKIALASPTNVAATVSKNQIDVTWNPVEGASSYTVTCGEFSKKITDGSTKAAFPELYWETTYTISVVAHPTDATVYRDSEPVVTEATTEVNPAAKQIATPTGLTATATDNKVSVAWDTVTDAVSYTVICNEQEIEVNTTSATIENLPWNTTLEVSVIANPDPANQNLAKSEPAITTVTIGEEPKIVKFTWKDVAKKNDLTTNQAVAQTINYNSITFVFDQSNGSTPPRTWNNNTELRLYKGNKITIKSTDPSKKITKIITDAPLPTTTDTGKVTNDTWTGSANSVTLFTSTKLTIKSFEITFE